MVIELRGKFEFARITHRLILLRVAAASEGSSVQPCNRS